MKGFLNYAKNRLLYNVLRILIIVGIGFIIGSCEVKAASVGAFGGLDINSSKIISGNNGYSTGQGYYVTQSSNAKNFIEYTFCLTDVLDFYTISVSGSISGDPVTVAYPKNSCQINNSTTGFIEKIYVNVLSYADAGNGNLGITLDSSIFNRHGYSVYAKLISVSTVDTITYDNTSDIINQNQTIIDQNTQAETTRKGIWDTLKSGISDIGNWFSGLGDTIINGISDIGTWISNLGSTIINGLIDGIKGLFMPSDDYLIMHITRIKDLVDEQLGFLATPFTLIIDFLNKYLEISSSEDIIINIPNITVPNFENHIIVHETTFNWTETLRSKESLNTLWQLYLDFIDVFLILNFIYLCERVYNRMFGGDTSNYEYYTVEDSITYDNNTGEVLSRRQNERTTKRKKVK